MWELNDKFNLGMYKLNGKFNLDVWFPLHKSENDAFGFEYVFVSFLARKQKTLFLHALHKLTLRKLFYLHSICQTDSYVGPVKLNF